MFAANTIHFKDITLSEPISDSEEIFMKYELDNFDREGYELLPIEQEFYKANNIGLSFKEVYAKESGQENGWFASTQKWITQKQSHPNIYLDHSFCVSRYGYSGKALEQLKHWAIYRPELNRLIYTKPKFGLDFCLDWITPYGVIELSHIEWDFRSYKIFECHRKKFEDIILGVDWFSKAAEIIDRKMEWVFLDAEAQGNWKSKLIGLDTAFNLYKSI